VCEALCPRNATAESASTWLLDSTAKARCSSEEAGCKPGEALATIGQDRAQLSRGVDCACKMFDYHWNFFELQQFGARVAPLAIITVLRDPVDRVISEYAYLSRHPAVLLQDQWDYLTSADLAARLRARGADGHPQLGVADFARYSPNPAHDRQARYLAGFARGALNGEAKCCLRRSWGHARNWAVEAAGGGADARSKEAAMERVDDAIARVEANTTARHSPGLAKISDAGPPPVGRAETARALEHLRDGVLAVGLLEREDETRELFEYQLGWPASVRPAGRITNASVAPKPRVSADLRAEIEARNSADLALCAEATRLFEARLARLHEKRRHQL
jgi:hypothetical protein